MENEDFEDIRETVAENNRILKKMNRGKTISRWFSIISFLIIILLSYYSYVEYFLPFQEELLSKLEAFINVFKGTQESLESLAAPFQNILGE